MDAKEMQTKNDLNDLDGKVFIDRDGESCTVTLRNDGRYDISGGFVTFWGLERGEVERLIRL